MDVSIGWVVIAAMIGLCAGIGLFAVLTMASERDAKVYPDDPGRAQTPI